VRFHNIGRDLPQSGAVAMHIRMSVGCDRRQ
jgi:hypothetical protein